MTENIKTHGHRPSKAEGTVGMKFARLTIVSLCKPHKNGQRKAVVKCECGRVKKASIYAVMKGEVRSCGCLKFEMMSARTKTHGATGTFEYNVWRSMRDRCRNPKSRCWMDYGGRGISICPQWDDFLVFLADVGKAPSEKHSLDRYPSNDGNYEPGNVRWATRAEQSRNKRNTRISLDTAKEILELYLGGIKRKDLAKRFGVPIGGVDGVIYKMKPRECVCPSCGHGFKVSLGGDDSLAGTIGLGPARRR